MCWKRKSSHCNVAVVISETSSVVGFCHRTFLYLGPYQRLHSCPTNAQQPLEVFKNRRDEQTVGKGENREMTNYKFNLKFFANY